MKKIFLGVVLLFATIMVSNSFALDKVWYQYAFKMQDIDNQYKMSQKIVNNLDNVSEDNVTKYYTAILVLLAGIKESGTDFHQYIVNNKTALKENMSEGYYLNLVKASERFANLNMDSFREIMDAYNKYSDNLSKELANDADKCYSVLLGCAVSSIIPQNTKNYIYESSDSFSVDTWENYLVGKGKEFLSNSQLDKTKDVGRAVFNYKRNDNEINKSTLKREAQELHDSLL